MKWLKLLIILSLLFQFSFASSDNGLKLDSLRRELKDTTEDTLKAKVLFSITWEFLKTRTELDSAKKYADSAILLCEKIQFEEGIAIVHYYQGVINRLAGAYPSALTAFNIYQNYFLKKGDSLRVANSLYQIGVIHSFLGNYEKSLAQYLRIMKIYENENNEYSLATTLNSIGIIYKNMMKYPEALESYNRALLIFRKLDSQIEIADCLSNIGVLFANQKDYPKSLEYFKQALEIDIQLKNDWGTAYQLKNIGSSLMKTAKYKEALKYNLKSLEMCRGLGQQKEIAMAHNGLGNNYFYLERYDEAIEHFTKGLAISLNIGAKVETGEAYETLSSVYSKTGDYRKALEYHQLYSQNKDSLINEVKMKQINELQAVYEAEKKENEILLLTKEREFQKAQLIQERKSKWTIMTGALILFVLIILMALIYRQKMKARQLIAKKNEEINRQKLLDLEKNQKLYALDAMISGQEVERKRIAQDLHDGLGVLLSTVQNQFNSIQQEFDKLMKMNVYQQANAMLDEACSEVRKIAHNMMPGTLLKLGLTPAIKDLCENLGTSSDTVIAFNALGMDERLEESVEITLYRLVQEAVNNAVKHSRATEILVQISKNNEQINLTIEDNGIGFNVVEAAKKEGMGLKNLESRVKYLNGTLDIQSGAGKGTSIYVDLPVYHTQTQ